MEFPLVGQGMIAQDPAGFRQDARGGIASGSRTDRNKASLLLLRFRVHHVERGGADPGLILHEIEQDKMSLRASVEMVEITACRLLLTHLLRPIVTGQTITEQAFDEIVREVKKHKARVAGTG